MFYQPANLAEALRIRADLGADATPLGGGTDIAVAVNHTGHGPENLLDLSHISGYSDAGRRGEEWRLGAGTTFAQMETLPLGALSQAAASVGGPGIRNRATIAGNLGTASPAGDGCTALLAMDAVVQVEHADRGRREIPIADYFTQFRQTALSEDELITGIRLPACQKTAWGKIGKRSSINISIVCVAIAMSPNGKIRIAMGSVAPTVIRAVRAEREIAASGQLDDATILEATKAAMQDASPIDDHRASASYRRAMCGVLVGRLLRQLRENGTGGSVRL